jgi:hypothetical protein
MVLMVLLILTAVALSLMFVTEIEMQMGGTERVLTQTHFGAESGLHAAIAGLPHQNWKGTKVAFVEGNLGQNRVIGTRTATSRIRAVGQDELPPMTLANEGESPFASFFVMVRSVSQRVSWPAVDPAPFYPEGSTRENLVDIQSHRSLLVRYLVSPIHKPESGEFVWNDKDTSPLSRFETGSTRKVDRGLD